MSKNQLKLLDESGLAGLKITEVNGRELVCEGSKVIDFCGTNYLGFDFQPELLQRGEQYGRRWGTMCGWSRLEADPAIYKDVEARICKLTGAPRALLSHTITITNFSVLPVIAQKGLILVDRKLHTVVWEACRLARDHGAGVEKFEHQDLNHLETLLKKHKNSHPRVIAVDGVYSISTELAPIRELQMLCKKYDAWLYVDDAHGFGVLGSDPSASNAHGKGGGGVVSHFNGNYDRTFYVSSFGKAFCTHSGFITLPGEFTDNLPAKALSHIYSAPVSPHTLGTVDAALDLNERIGDGERAKIRQLVQYFCDGVRRLGYEIENHRLHPVIFVPIGELSELIVAAKALLAGGVFTGLRAYPVVPENECGVRFAITSLHTKAHLDQALKVLGQLDVSKARRKCSNVAA
ncbi:MAG: aminotransferase class I/II-fold pyridoxal phosphate-dependent enzyme [Deltaproteobacteria bacterium]|nr:aminotransferase class I/II-fold pyridoxal phosphate-dependent enzyme [Deltaproteobacteria bacterium]